MTNFYLLEGQQQAQGGAMMILYLVAIVVFFYFFMIRPQKKQEKQTQEMRNALTVGDEITTIGGIIGRITHIKDDVITIETGADRNKIRIRKSAIASVDKKKESTKSSSYKVKTAKKTEEKPALKEEPVMNKEPKKATKKKQAKKQEPENQEPENQETQEQTAE